MKPYQHWHVEKSAENIIWLSLDRFDASVNSLNIEVLNELDDLLTFCVNQRASALIISSGKQKGFVAGADIKEFIHLQTAEEAYRFMRHGQKIFNRLAQLSISTVAMIHGFCLGGGLELALACDYRVADENNSIFGFPEVKLGLHPGWGGTVRAPQLIGPLLAFELMLEGRTISSIEAKKFGLIDAIVPLEELKNSAMQFALAKPKMNHHRSNQILYGYFWVRKLLGMYLLKKLANKLNRNSAAAIHAMIHLWVEDGAEGEKAMQHEAQSIAALMMGETSRELVRLFFSKP